MWFDPELELKNAWIKQLRKEWHDANYYSFNDCLAQPDIDLFDSETMLGKWEGKTKRRISISIFLIRNHPWQYVQEVLYHEMAHQYVEEWRGISDALPHGEIFRKVCVEKGLDSRASGSLQEWIEKKKNPRTTGPEYKILHKAHKLLSLAQSQNRHEAESAMTKAQELLLKHNLSLLEFEKEREYTHKQIGEVGRKSPVKSLVGIILSKFFFVECIWIFGYDAQTDKQGRVLDIFGTSENIEMAEYVHDYLHNVSELLWKGHKEQNRIGGNKHRRTFIYGLLNGFFQKLDAKAVENKGKSLVWRGDSQLKEYYRRRNPKIQSARFSYSKSCSDTYNSGLQTGKKLVVSKGVSAGSSGGGYLLGS